MKTVHEKKLKDLFVKYLVDEKLRDEIMSLVDDIVDDEKYDARNDGYAEGTAAEASWHQDSDYYR